MQIKKLVEEVLDQAITEQTSDIFIFPKKEQYQLAFRRKQQVEIIRELSYQAATEMINYFKYAAQMDISEHRRPQVGAMTYQKEVAHYLRFSSLGDFNDHESMVIRIIYPVAKARYFFKEQLEQVIKLTKRRGLFITSGPTGSGKTTTMYEVAKKAGQDKVVMTIEDPVEVYEENFLQAQVNLEAQIDYLTLLKAALRHRPDILIIGEIRDAKTARLAIDAALSGHLVFATVHAKNTLQTLTRLQALGIRSDELMNSLTCISYQRLLPSRTGQQCLIDLAFGEQLYSSIMQEVRGDFLNWEQNLQQLLEGGVIDAATYELFKQG